MKKVGILTFHDEPNYGAFLQTYGLYKFVSKQGYDVEIIDLRLKDTFKFNFLVKLVFPILNLLIWKSARNKYLKLSKTTYKNIDDIHKNPPEYDIYLLGSDQVWNKDITKDFKYLYFFDFIKSKKSKISYASSFGMKNWEFNEQESHHIKSLLNDFSSVNVRESSAKKLLKENCNLESNIVVDPVLLLNDFSDITDNHKQLKNRMVCFKFTKNNGFYTFLNKLKQNTNLDILVLNKTTSVEGVKTIPIPSIKKWLKSIAEAEYVLTDSYHGLLFSLIFKKKFIVLPANIKNFDRLKDLLTLLNLEGRIFYDYEDVLNNDSWKSNIDYKSVDKILEKNISFSRTTLINSLNGI